MKKYGICRVEKYSADAVAGIQKHDRREATQSNTNKDINYSKSYLNYDLSKGDKQLSFRKKVRNIINRLNLKRRLRSDANVMCQVLCTASSDFFADKTEQEIKQFFVECYNTLSKKYGEENVVSAFVHLDEKTPHMHFNFVPVTKDKRISSRDLFTRQTLTELQTEMHSKVFSKYGLDRGETKEDKQRHYSTQVYKVLTLEQEIDRKKQELSTLQNDLNNNKLYQLKSNLKSLQDKLSQMFEILESNPKLMKEYKQAIEKLKSKEERER